MELNEALKILNSSDADSRLLARIAYENEDLQLSVVHHQNAYPQLLKWLALFGDPRTSEVAFARMENEQFTSGIQQKSPKQPDRQVNAQSQFAAQGVRRTFEQPVVVNNTVNHAQDQPKQHNYTIVQALDPNLDLDIMCDIAKRAPELREYIARNRNAYPTLLQWLASLNDPSINRALAMRN
ncbi:MAG: hypothetical protein LBI63_06105 [Candidatus Ancillula sp.]|jgi:hypothetical protein|nr:hypothetical protein [Candidatus Ancillula sp.]